MQWRKLGRIFNPEILKDRGLSCALMPLVETIDYTSDTVRVYFCPRDESNCSQLHYFDVSLSAPNVILNISSQPLFEAGVIGSHDDSGITSGSFSEIKGSVALYYTGWNLTKNVPFNNSIGIAVRNEEGNFVRLGDGPIMTRTLDEPYSCASPFVLRDEGLYRMWYASMDQWKKIGSEVRHYYNIKYAESKDGINWQRQGIIALNYQNEAEYAFGRPFVLKESGVYKMWYAVRGESYRIGYAESVDGISWTRKDSEVGIDVSESGWDSEMIEYPCIFDHKGSRYMLYNGNDYGRSGIGLAVLVAD